MRARVASGAHGKYQLDVTACDVTDVVRHAGGWLYDRAMAGWDVSVLVSDAGDVTPLRILGLRTQRLGPEDDPTAPPRALALAASTDALAANSLLREDVLRAMKRGLVEVTLWGEPGSERVPVRRARVEFGGARVQGARAARRGTRRTGRCGRDLPAQADRVPDRLARNLGHAGDFLGPAVVRLACR